MNIKLKITLLSILISGFGAQAAKPDFAFPKQVSQTAEKELKAAMKQSDGPATIRALIDLSLANNAMEPDSIDAESRKVGQVASQVKDPTTKAMAMLLRSQIDGRTQWADSALTFSEALQSAPVAEWKNVIQVNAEQMPTLYDFAVALRISREPSDSLLTIVRELHRSEPMPYLYWSMEGEGQERARELFNEYRNLWESYYPLVRLTSSWSTVEEKRRLWEDAAEWERRFSTVAPAEAVEQVRKMIGVLTEKRVNINSRSINMKGSELPVRIQASNVNDFELVVYRYVREKNLLKTERVSATHISLPGTGAFDVDTVVNIALPDEYGKFLVKPQIAGDDKENNYRKGLDVIVTDMVLERETLGSHCNYFALNPVTGEEVKDAIITRDINSMNVKKGDDKYSPEVGLYTFRETDAWNDAGVIFTDAATYHPGDTIRFAVTAYQFYSQGSVRRVIDGQKLNVGLRDTNWQQIQQKELVTDSLGRAHGEFVVPSTGLTGWFSIEAKEGNNHLGSKTIPVADYKVPQFAVTAEANRIDSIRVVVEGTAVNYSGFPVQDAAVKLTVNKLAPWVWYRNYSSGVDQQILTDTVTTDAQGRFRFEINVAPTSSYAAFVAVTSTIGETRDASCFLPCKPYFISANIPANLQAGAAPRMMVIDGKGEPANDIALSFRLTSPNDTIDNVKDWSKVPSGLYTLSVNTVPAGLADEFTQSDVCIYRRSDRHVPYETTLWVPETEIKDGDEIIFGTSKSGLNLRYVLWTPDTIISEKWITPKSEISRFKPKLPEGTDNATLTLWTMNDYGYYTKSVKIVRDNVGGKSASLSISSLRDRTVPGDTEKWTIKMADNLGTPMANSAVILDVYAKALDVLAPHSLTFSPRQGFSPYYALRPGAISNTYGYTTVSAQWPQLKDVYAQFNTYGQRFTRGRIYDYAVTASFGSANFDNGTDGMVRTERKEMLMSAKAEADMTTEEAAEDTAEAVTDAVAANEPECRMPEMAVALWQPTITTDASGEAQIEFTVPNANTTWAVKAVGYTPELLTAAFNAEVIASKPIMVQAQWPRMLRQTDRMILRGLVMNNTDSAVIANVAFEVYDPLTGNVIERKEYEPMRLEPMKKADVELSIDVPADCNQLGLRITGLTGRYSDGEQCVVAVLPSSQQVIESQAILMEADSANLHLELKPGSVVEITSNAVWDCVTALPAISSEQSASALAAITRLYCAATAQGLLSKYPMIRKALHSWQDTDSLLVSRLQRNPDLKTVLLENTPWVSAAQSQTENMARLSLYLSQSNIDKAIDTSVKDLAKLVTRGGFKWHQQSEEPSLWVTLSVLNRLGQLRQMNFLPQSKRIDQFISEGWAYADAEAVKEFSRYKSPMEFFTLVRSRFPELKTSTAVDRVITFTVQHLLADWRHLSFNGKADAALILNAHGYGKTASLVLESLRQYGAWKRTGITPNLLRAFSTIEPAGKDVDEIRMFLISRKQTMDWGTGANATDVVSALLLSGSDWLVPSANSVSVFIDGHEQSIPAEDSYLGRFRFNLPEGGEFEFRKGQYPAWGGVWSRYEAEIDSIDNVASKELSITRTVSGDLSVGSRVKVTITVKADRPMDYVVVKSPHVAGLEAVNQLPHYIGGWWNTIYAEPTSQATTFFINRLQKGVTTFTEEYYVTAEGCFLMAPATVQSQYAPEFTATTAADTISVD